MLIRLFSTIFGAGVGFAVATVTAYAADDIEAKAQMCAACHGQSGVPTDPTTIPVIWGQERSYLFKQMRDYRNGERDNPIMSPIAKGLAEEDTKPEITNSGGAPMRSIDHQTAADPAKISETRKLG